MIWNNLMLSYYAHWGALAPAPQSYPPPQHCVQRTSPKKIRSEPEGLSGTPFGTQLIRYIKPVPY